MKIYFMLTLILSVLLITLPLISTVVMNNSGLSENNASKTAVSNTPEAVSVFLAEENKTVETELFDYLVSAVAAEMPASYEKEALKAQAVACCSYMMWIKENSDNPGYDISSDPAVHQGYLTDEEMREKWQDKYESYKGKIEDAVSAVYGEYMTYEGEAILALFHGISPGSTQSSEDVWESPLPYIKAKSAPGDTLSPDFDSQVTVSAKKIRELFSVTEEVSDSEVLDIFSMSDTAYKKKIPSGKGEVSAGDIASRLGLRSPYFTAEYKQGNYIFNVKGYGHGLGMSQYSADYMARQGSDYREILMHFYEGIEISDLNA